MVERTALYRLFDATDGLLYIGISWRPEDRFRAYRSERSWWPDVARSEIEWFDSRAEARQAEVSAIAREHPRYNVAETPLHARVSGHKSALTEQELACWAATDTFSGRRTVPRA